VAMLRLTGIPVFREGTFFSIPSGDWSVVEGCSGVRYLIASVTLGVIYAYLTYHRFWKRLLFILVSVIVPVIANGLRAYMIVMIAHLSDMKLALGVDHFIYGWVFFGIVITILFLLGAIWRDPVPALPAPSLANAPIHRTGSPLAASLLVLLATAIWPLTALTLGRDLPPHAPGVELPAPPGAAGWQAVEGSDWDWRPETLAPDAERYQFYRRDGHTVGLSLGLYLTQRQDAELVNSQNMLVRQKHPVWSNKGRDQARIDLAGSTTTVDQAKLVSARQRLLVWHWYRVGATYTSNPYLAKVLEALSRLTGGRRDGVLISLATLYENRTDEAKPVLQAFLADMLPQVEAVLDRAAGAQ